MGKRLVERDVSPYTQRQISHGPAPALSTSTRPAEITSGQDLRWLLAFSQEDASQLRERVQDFKVFLDSIAYGDDLEGQSLRRGVLLDYLLSQRKERDGSDQVDFSDLIQSWGFATQANNENLYSAIAAVLALFLKTISGSLDFREFGNQLCRTLLEQDQIKLLERGLSASRAKEHVVSPCLRLLTEIVSYDGGTAAKAVWRCRGVTFKHLELFLTMRKSRSETLHESQRKPSVRDNALRYFFANLRCQSPIAKAGILQLAQGKVARNVFRDLQRDPPSLVLELLSLCKKAVLWDEQLPRHIKTTLFREGTLSQVASLYQYDEADGPRETRSVVQQAAHSFLLQVCTSSRVGILECSEDAADAHGRDAPDFSLGGQILTGNALSTTYGKQSPRQNKAITSFLQELRPYKQLMEKDLILAVFRAAPELVADYFQKNSSFTYDPKLSATWVGYCMFLISVIQLPIPDSYLPRQDHEGNIEHNVEVSTLIESILPSPLTQKSMTKAINQACGLVKFCAVKVLTAAFIKCNELMKKLHALGKGQVDTFGKNVSSQLSSVFASRCPEMRHIIAGFRGCSKGHSVLHESFTRLLAFYYRVTPQAALQEKFDISHVLIRATSDQDGITSNNSSMIDLGLEGLLDIAERSLDMDWWHKPDGMSLSPFTTLLRKHTQSSNSMMEAPIPSVLQRAAEDARMIQYSDDFPSISILCSSLEGVDDHESSDKLYQFLDHCILQFQRKSVLHYEARLALIDQQHAEDDPDCTADVDLLLFAVADQWPFLASAAETTVLTHITTWIADYLDISLQAGKDLASLLAIRKQISEATADKACSLIIERLPAKPTSVGIYMRHKKAIEQSLYAPIPVLSEVEAEPLDYELPPGPAEEDDDHRVLNHWKQEAIPEIVLEGTVSDWIDASRIYLVIGEVVETVEHHPPEQPLPNFAAAFAARSCSVYADPLHPMYMKIHKYVMKGPEWKLYKMPSYWVDRILLRPPTDDDGYLAEVEWLLDFLVDGLRTPTDMKAYLGRGDIFEHLLTLFASPSLPKACRKKIIHLLHRCTHVEGSTALITRCGLLSWINIHLAADKKTPEEGFLLRSVAKRAYDTCDKNKVDEWSGGRAVNLLP